MRNYTEQLWQLNVKHRYQLLGESRTPTVSCSTIPLPFGTNRQTEVKLLGLMYKQNLLNLFLSAVQKKQCSSPLCECLEDVQSGFHLITACPLVDCGVRDNISEILIKYNNADSFELVIDDYISVLNCSRSKIFIEMCLKIVANSKLNLRSEFTIMK